MHNHAPFIDYASAFDSVAHMKIIIVHEQQTEFVSDVSDGTAFYFDSYGLEPAMEIKKYCNEPRFFNTFEIQKPNEVICGHLCLYFLYTMRMRNCNAEL